MDSQDTQTKNSYEKPKLRIIRIEEGQEVMAVGCKLTDSGTAANVSPCIPGNFCTQVGS